MPDELDPQQSRASSNTPAYTVFVVAFVIRLLVVFAVWHSKPSHWFYSQASELGEVAQSIVTGHGIASPFGGNTGPSAFLPPGYPLFVSSAFRVFGAYSRSAELALLLCQAAFGAVAVLLAMLLARRFFGSTTANVTGILLAFDPWLIALGFVFWDTSCSLMLLPALVLLASRWLYRPSPGIAYSAAAIGAITIAINASLALVCLALFAWAVYRQPRGRSLSVIPGILFILLTSIWPLRNVIVMHSFIPLRDNLGYELWQGNRIGADGFFAPELHPNTNLAEFKAFRDLGELAYMQEKSQIARSAIQTQPAHFFFLTVKRFFCFWLGISRQTFPNQIAVATMTTLLGLAGLFVFIRRRGLKVVVPVLIPLLLFPLPYYVTHPDFRFWCLLSPLLTACAAYLFVGKRHGVTEN